VDRETVHVYEAQARAWRDRRPPRFLDRVASLTATVRDGGVVADLGCGAGSHLPHLTRPAIALDAAHAMLELARAAAPDVPAVQADLEALPFRRGALAGAWARASYLHVPRSRLPAALAELHHSLAVGASAHLSMLGGDDEGSLPDDDFAGRFFAQWRPGHLEDVLVGAGFSVTELLPGSAADDWMHVLVSRARTLPDTVGPGMRLLVCGLNPSVYSADVGVGFARPGNRFWPAAIAAGLVAHDRDPRHALAAHGVGMTDLVKRATRRADELTPVEYRAGAARVERLVEWLRPGAVCFVGLAGWRAAIDRRAVAGLQRADFGGRPAYVMPSTSGLNARVPLTELTEHLRAAASLAPAHRVDSAPPSRSSEHGSAPSPPSR
jgi:double-stranded uracil-DNA glycosylase